MGSGGVKCTMQSSTPLNFLGPLLCLLQQHLQPSIYFCFSLGQYMISSQGYFVYCGTQKNTKLHIMTYRSVSLLSKGPVLNQAVAHSRGCCKRMDPHTQLAILASKASSCLGPHFSSCFFLIRKSTDSILYHQLQMFVF